MPLPAKKSPHIAHVSGRIGAEDGQGPVAEISLKLSGLTAEHAHDAAGEMVKLVAALGGVARKHVT